MGYAAKENQPADTMAYRLDLRSEEELLVAGEPPEPQTHKNVYKKVWYGASQPSCTWTPSPLRLGHSRSRFTRAAASRNASASVGPEDAWSPVRMCLWCGYVGRCRAAGSRALSYRKMRLPPAVT